MVSRSQVLRSVYPLPFFIWFVSIPEGGIVVLAGICVMKLERYRAIGRISELLTIVALPIAGLSIFVDMRRFDRVFSIIVHFWVHIRPRRRKKKPSDCFIEFLIGVLL